MSMDNKKFTPHKHAEIIKAWADGMPIQLKFGTKWIETEAPTWGAECEYRVKPAHTHITFRMGLFKFRDYRNDEEYYAVRAVELRYPGDQDFPTLGGELIRWLSASETIDLTDL